MDIEQFQAIEKQLAEQAEANCITNDNLANLVQMMSNRESKNIVPTPLAPTPISQPITTILRALQPSWIRLCTPNDFDRDQLKGCCHTLIKCVSRCAGSVLNQAVSGCSGEAQL
jgi:hypothetical protein